MTVRYRGGPECWYEIRTRGGIIRRPGVLGIHDLMTDIYAGYLKDPYGRSTPTPAERGAGGFRVQ